MTFFPSTDLTSPIDTGAITPVTMNWPALGQQVTSPLTGTVYQIGQRRGEGYYAVVFDAADCWNNELVVKILRPERGTFEEVTEAATKEFQNLIALRNPFITHVYDGFIYGNACYIVTERCDGTLESLIEQPWYHGPAWTMPVGRCLLQAINYIHDQGMVHKDIHLGNVLLTSTRCELRQHESTAIKFKLADLGICKIAEEVDARNTLLANFIRPPEAIDPDQFGPIIPRRVDIYHAGLALLQVHIGKKLLLTEAEILAGVPRQLAETIAPPTGPAIARALRRHAFARYQSARDFWLELSGYEIGN